MRAVIGRTSLAAAPVLGAVLALAQPGAAQDAGSVTDYRLPDPTATVRPQVQGPVDPDNPYGRPSATPAPSPAPSAAPRIELPAPAPAQRPVSRPSATPSPAPSQRSTAGPGGDASAPAAGGASPAAEPLPPTEQPAETSPAPVIDPAPAPVPAPLSDDPVAASEAEDKTWLVAAVAAAFILALAAFLVLRRRRSVEPEPAEEPEAAVPEPQPSPPARLPARPARPAPVPPPAPAASLRDEPLPLATTFSAKTMRLSLVYATLQYELVVANAGAEPLPPLQVRADLASAHAGADTREQLAPAPELLEARHTTPALAPGESVTFMGEVRLPLQQIRPLVKGNARFLLPLARFLILGPEGAGVRRVFTLGPRDPNGGAIASVRLDAGPRNLRELEAREIEAARGFTLDPVAAHV